MKRGKGAKGQRGKGAKGQRGKGAKGQRGKGREKNGRFRQCLCASLPLCLSHTFAFCLLPFALGGLFLSACNDQEGDVTAEADGQSLSKPTAVEKTEPVTGQPTHQHKAVAEMKNKHTNRLARETSPYLLLHAHNPVDWYPWGPEAFEKARREGKPIFLSIGYSSCYWCHVMARLVFENEEIARYMNEHFVNIKVDREERPDVDDIYMTALQVYFQMIGSPQGGGWPLSMFLTPGGKPFAGGTYFPPKDDHGRPGFATVTKNVSRSWKERQKDIEEFADALTKHLRGAMQPKPVATPVKIDRALVALATTALKESHDPQYGGIDFNPGNPNSPKFPVPAKLALLQYEIRRHDDRQAAEVLYHTLDHLAAGGIYDHVGDGFHRYSTDRYWHVPHFEKMLYDQAQLADVYVEAFRRTGKPLYRDVVEGIFTFVLREMTDPRGGFYSALDAETDGVEGEYYVWSKQQIDELLDAEDAKLFKKVYGMEEPQVFEHGYVLHLPKPLDLVAEEMKVSPAELKGRLDGLRKKILDARSKRQPLLRDDKILTSWNGLMIRAFANAGAVLSRDDYVQTAEKAARFILEEMRDDEGRLHRTYRAKQAKLNAYLDDYAFLIEGLLSVHQATQDDYWLDTARQLTDEEIRLFWDKKGKAFFFTSHHHEELIARTKNAYDAVLPAGNSVSVRNLIRLASLAGEEKYRRYAREILEVFTPSLEQVPRGMTNMALATAEFLDGSDLAAAPTETSGSETSPTGENGLVFVAAAQQNKEKKKDEKLTARAFLSVDKLPAGRTCKIVLLVDVNAGWHINANPAKPDFLKPTTFSLKSKHGTKMTVPRYPAGKKLSIKGFDEPLLVYDKRVAIFGTLNIPQNAAGKSEEIQLHLHYQACNDSQCLRPTTLTLQGRLPVAGPGEPVKQINQNLFPKPK